MVDSQMWTPQTVIKKPWGHEKIIKKTKDYVVKELYLKPNSRLSLQYHLVKNKTMFLVSGQVWLKTLPFKDFATGYQWMYQLMNKLQPYHIQTGLRHRLFTKDQAALVVEISSIELDDVVRIEDDYGRTE